MPGREHSEHECSLRIRREIVAAAGDQRPARPHRGHKATRRRPGAKS